MPLLRSIVSVASITLALASGACAGASSAQRTQSRRQGHRATMTALGFRPIGTPSNGAITRGQTVRTTAHLTGGSCYRIVALGDGDALDLEVALVSPSGQRAAASETSGADASVRYCPTDDGDFAMTLAARAGNGEYELGVWEDRATAGGVGDEVQRGTCEAPYVLDFAHPVEGSTANARDNTSGTCLRGRGPDVIYTLAVPTRRRVTITVRTDFDAALYLQHDCGANQTEISCCNLAVVRGVSRIDTVLDAGSYFVVVDSVENGRRGRFTLEAQLGEAPELAQVCASLPAITPSTPGHPQPAIHASTSGRPDLMRASCAEGRFPGPDQAYALALTESSRVRASLAADGEWDPGLYVRSGCVSEDTEVACNDDAGDAQHARITRTLVAGSYAIVVDGYVAGSQGDFALEVETAPAAGSGVANDACDTAAPLGLDTSVEGDTFAAHDDVSGSCGGGDGAPDVMYRLNVPRRSHVTAELTRSGLGETVASSRMYFVRGCGGARGEASCGRGRVDAVLAPGTWFLVVDGASRDDFGRFTLQTQSDDAAGVDAACRNVPAITPGQTVRGTTAGADRLHASCGNRAQSPDKVYSLRLTERRHVTLALQAQFDSVLSLRGACERESSEIACNDDDTSQRTSRIDADLDTGTYYVVVDGFHQGNAGNFTLDATLGEPRPPTPVTLGASSPPPARQPTPRASGAPVPSLPTANPCSGGGPGAGH